MSPSPARRLRIAAVVATGVVLLTCGCGRPVPVATAVHPPLTAATAPPVPAVTATAASTPFPVRAGAAVPSTPPPAVRARPVLITRPRPPVPTAATVPSPPPPPPADHLVGPGTDVLVSPMPPYDCAGFSPPLPEDRAIIDPCAQPVTGVPLIDGHNHTNLL